MKNRVPGSVVDKIGLGHLLYPLPGLLVGWHSHVFWSIRDDIEEEEEGRGLFLASTK